MPSCKGNCGCGFGKKKSAFGTGADKFFNNSFTGNTSIGSIDRCLNYGVYGAQNKAPLTRFGSKPQKVGGPMKISKK